MTFMKTLRVFFIKGDACWIPTSILDFPNSGDILDQSNIHIRRLREELLNPEIFDTLLEARVLLESWRRDHNRIRPHSSLGYKPPAPEAYAASNLSQQVAW